MDESVTSCTLKPVMRAVSSIICSHLQQTDQHGRPTAELHSTAIWSRGLPQPESCSHPAAAWKHVEVRCWGQAMSNQLGPVFSVWEQREDFQVC